MNSIYDAGIQNYLIMLRDILARPWEDIYKGSIPPSI